VTAAAVTALVVTVAAMPVVLSWLRHWQLLDHPNPRSSHSLPTPRGGGIAVVLGMAGGLVVAQVSGNEGLSWLLVPVVVYALLGLADDRKSLPASLRLAVQALAAVGVVLVLLQRVGPPAGIHPWWGQGVCCAAAVVWVVGCTNAFNFMDGVNGISSLNAILAGVFFAWLGASRAIAGMELTGVIIAVSALGFLPWNAPQARIFLGDVGSYALGSALALCGVWAAWAGIDVVLVAAPLGIYVGDTSWALLKRLRGHRPWQEAHREHVYQQLVDGGISHLGSATITVTASALLVALVALLDESSSIGVAIGAAGIMVVYLSLPRLIGATATRRQSAGAAACG
jgi:UDP-GlcNAc:undecaprenyl-phosphate/decaprenyl-phosphate GlcNAc-1-phosphate transferase